MARIQSRPKKKLPEKALLSGAIIESEAAFASRVHQTARICPQARRFSAAILGGLQGKATQYASKKTPGRCAMITKTAS